MKAKKQEKSLRPALEKLFPIICISCFGAMPDDFDFEFNSVRTSSEAERADLAKNIVGSVLDAYNSELIDKATAMSELRKSSALTGMFTRITDEQIDAAKREAEEAAMQAANQPQMPGMEEMGMTPGAGQPGAMPQQAPPPVPVAQDAYAMDSRALDWNEEDHPRGEKGRFEATGNSGAEVNTPKEERNSSVEKQGNSDYNRRVKDYCDKLVNGKLSISARQEHHLSKEASEAEFKARRERNPDDKEPPKSYFTINKRKMLALVREKIKAGEYTTEKTRDGSARVTIEPGYKIGQQPNEDGSEPTPMNKITVVFGGNHWHCWPTE